MIKKPIIAVIDIGSNSIRLQISAILGQTYKIVEELKESVRIGDNVFKTGTFSDDAIETILSILTQMKRMMDNCKVSDYRITATASFREAKNGKDVVKTIKDKIGLRVEIIDGKEEARLMALATTSSFQIEEGNTLIIDMGGGSTEFSYFENGKLKSSDTTELGSSKLAMNFIKHDPIKSKELNDLEKYIKLIIGDFLPKSKITRLICAGGSINNISAIYNKRGNLSDSTVKFVDTVFLKHFFNEVKGKNVAERLKIPALEPTRVDMIIPATMLVKILLKENDLNGFYTLSGGLRGGLTIDVMNKLGYTLLSQSESTDIRYSKLIETGKKYAFEEKHSLHVTMLAKDIFNQLKGLLKLKDDDWKLLEASSLLHDVGQYISYSKHHKHSYYLIINSELSGYNEKENHIVANIARYHRRSLPKKTHSNFEPLDEKEKELVLKLASILRIADGLDRTHSSYINGVDITISKSSIAFALQHDKEIDISMERDGFEKKKDLLGRISNMDVCLA